MTRMPPRSTLLLLAAALALATTLAPHADAGGRHGPRPSPAERIARYAEELGLDAETQAELAKIAEESKAEDEALRAEKRAAHQRMRELLSAPELDHDAVRAQADVLDALRARAHRNRLDAMLRVHELLTPEQRQALVAMRERRHHAKRGRGPLGGCSGDLRAHCVDAPDGPAALRCLADRWDALSDACRHAVTGRRPGPPPAAPEER
jgi:Spy/CpxP family protein refolding chaperone